MSEHASVPPEQAERKRLAEWCRELAAGATHAATEARSDGMLLASQDLLSESLDYQAIAAALDAPRHSLGKEPSERAIKVALRAYKATLEEPDAGTPEDAMFSALRNAYAIDGALDAPREATELTSPDVTASGGSISSAIREATQLARELATLRSFARPVDIAAADEACPRGALDAAPPNAPHMPFIIGGDRIRNALQDALSHGMPSGREWGDWMAETLAQALHRQGLRIIDAPRED